MYIDLLTKLKNAQLAKKKTIESPLNGNDKTVAEILQQAGFLTKMESKGRPPKLLLELNLNPQKPIRGIKFLSRPSLRRYSSYENFHKVKGGQGLLVVSTSKGIMIAEKARKAKLGGQLLFEIW